MNVAVVEKPARVPPVISGKSDRALPAWIVTGPTTIAVRADARELEQIKIVDALESGADYAIVVRDGGLVAVRNTGDVADVLGGFHFAPGGSADDRRQGGDTTPAINPFSIWDIAFRPACPDPRGMTLVEAPHGRFWCDIYLTAADHLERGTSWHGATIADGEDPPLRPDGSRFEDFDQATAIAVLAHHGKTLLSPEDFFHAAFGVTEATSAGKDPKSTGLDAPRTSKRGVMQAAGNMSTWGHDGDPIGPNRACLFGGDWDNGKWAGSRYANVASWPDSSDVWIGARGRSDHLQLA